jgi:hypothetical protein
MKNRDRSFVVHLCLFLVLIALPFQGGCAQVENTNPSESAVSPSPQGSKAAETRQIPAIVETVEVNVLESLPLQLTLTVTGNFQDGCEAPLKVKQQQDGDRLDITLYRELPADAVCPAVMTPFEETVPLEGGFESGTYMLDVNGIAIEQKI